MEYRIFGVCWCKWTYEFISTSYLSILINDSLSPSLINLLTYGLRQRDSLSPSLINLAVEGLSILITRATHIGMLSGIKVQ